MPQRQDVKRQLPKMGKQSLMQIYRHELNKREEPKSEGFINNILGG